MLAAFNVQLDASPLIDDDSFFLLYRGDLGLLSDSFSSLADFSTFTKHKSPLIG